MTCKLCLGQGPLKNSHILPEFLYKGVYPRGKPRQLLVLSSDPNEDVELHQKGFRERLLCESCEGLLNTYYEQYACKVLARAPDSIEMNPVPTSKPEPRGFQVFDRVDYTRMRLFFLSLLWRLAVTSRDELRGLKLGENEDILRQMLLSRTPGNYDYFPFTISKLANSDGSDAKFISKPQWVKVFGCRAVAVGAGEFYIHFFFEGHLTPDLLRVFFLQPSGRLVIGLRYMAEFNHLVRSARKVMDADDVRKSAPKR